jgi:rubrerythrin
VRSRAAASVLSNAGFNEVYSMSGGINAWNGLVASGAPDAGIAYFPDNEKPGKVVVLAWLLEEGARRFYKGVEELLDDKKAIHLFKELGAAEVRHKSQLVKLYRELFDSGSEPESSDPFVAEELNDVMESGMRISEALDWVKGKGIMEILDYSIAMETNSYDLYIKMERRVKEEELKKVFSSLSHEEKTHLERLVSLLEERV